MSLNLDDVKKIAHLARLKIDETELSKYLAQLNQTFAMIDTLTSINTEKVETHSDEALILRSDTVTENNMQPAFEAITPNTMAGLYLVPKVIE
jgi:aspartyl-tRNA(Asn)/glutamyl-tRNA(Gln) amidotransferase subunit C